MQARAAVVGESRRAVNLKMAAARTAKRAASARHLVAHTGTNLVLATQASISPSVPNHLSLARRHTSYATAIGYCCDDDEQDCKSVLAVGESSLWARARCVEFVTESMDKKINC